LGLEVQRILAELPDGLKKGSLAEAPARTAAIHPVKPSRAEGYERWSLGLRYKITNSRRWDVPVVLKPLPMMPVTPEEL